SSFGGYVPQPGDQYVVIRNDSSDPVTGNFSGLPEGAMVSNFLGVSGLTARVTYQGGDGNDVAVVVDGPANFTSAGGSLTLKLDPTGVNLQLFAGAELVDARPVAGV